MNQETMSSQNETQIPASFRQKSAGVSLVVISSIAVYYFAQAIGMMQTGQLMPDGALGLIVFTVIAIIVVESTLQIVLAVGSGKIPSITKRDEWVNLKAFRNAYYVVLVGVLAVFSILFMDATPFMMANLALFAMILAEIVRFASQLVYYSRSA